MTPKTPIIRIYFIRILISLIILIGISSCANRGDQVDTLEIITSLPAYNGTFPGTMLVGSGITKTPFTKGLSTPVTLVYSNFRDIETYEVYQDEDSDYTCDYVSNAVPGDYESQSGCIVDYSIETRGAVSLDFTSLGTGVLGPLDYDSFGEYFYINNDYFYLTFSKKSRFTTDALHNPFRVKIIKMDILLLDTGASISY